MKIETYRLSSIVDHSSLPTYGPEGQPIRVLIRNSDDAEVCAVRSDAGPVTVGDLTADEAVERWAAPMDDGEGEYYQIEMRSAL